MGSFYYGDTAGCLSKAKLYLLAAGCLFVLAMMWFSLDWIESQTPTIKQHAEAAATEMPRREPAPTPPIQVVPAGPRFGGAAVLIPETGRIWWFDDKGAAIDGAPAFDKGDTLVGGWSSLVLIGKEGVAVITPEGKRIRSKPPRGFGRGARRIWLSDIAPDLLPVEMDLPSLGTLITASSSGSRAWDIQSSETLLTDGRALDLGEWELTVVAPGETGLRAASANGRAVRVDTPGETQSVLTAADPVIALSWLPDGRLAVATAKAVYFSVVPEQGGTVELDHPVAEGEFSDMLAGAVDGQSGALCEGSEDWQWVAQDADPKQFNVTDPTRLGDGRLAEVRVDEPVAGPVLEVLTLNGETP